MLNRFKLLGTVSTLALAVVAKAASPVWVVQTLTNLRRVAYVTKNGTKAVVILGKCRHAFPDVEISRLAKIAAKKDGLKEVGKILGWTQDVRVLEIY